MIFLKSSADVLSQNAKIEIPRVSIKKQEQEKYPEFTGITSPYEEPENPEIIVDTDKDSVEECAEKIIDHLKKEGVLNRKI